MGKAKNRYKTRKVGNQETSASKQQTVNHNFSKNAQSTGLWGVKEYSNILDKIEKAIASLAAMVGLTGIKLTLSVGMRLFALTIFLLFSIVVSIDSFYQINGGISLIPCPVREEPWIGWFGWGQVNPIRLIYSTAQMSIFNAAQSIFFLINQSSHLIADWPKPQRMLLWFAGAGLSGCELVWVFADRWPLDAFWLPGLNISEKITTAFAWAGWNVYVVFAIAVGASLFSLTLASAQKELGYKLSLIHI